MGIRKKLDISYEKLVEIALELNENIIANKTRIKEEKISTDTYIKKFGINRKDFSETIKNTDISYNKSTFLYDINKDDTKVNDGLIKVIPKLYHKSETSANTEVLELLDIKGEILEIIEWYKNQKNITEIPEIKIDIEKLSGKVYTKGFKIYEEVMSKFDIFCKVHKQYTKQDLMAMAIIEYMEKYK